MTTPITRMEVFHVRIPMRLGFRHAGAARKVAECLLVRVHAGTAYGLGEAIPRVYLTGETVETALYDLERVWWPRLAGLARARGQDPYAVLRDSYEHADATKRTAAYAAVDLACFDLWARQEKRPVHELLAEPGVFREYPLTASIGLGGLALALTAPYRARGFRDYKVKVSSSTTRESLRRVRQLVGKDAKLRADANGAWNLEQAERAAAWLAELGFSSIEEPLQACDVEGMAKLQARTTLDVMADESLCNRDDAQRLAAARAARGWNLRLAKLGGFSGMRALVRMADAAGVAYQFGVLVGETSILQTALRHALVLGTPRHVEWGFARALLALDPVKADAATTSFPTTLNAQATEPGFGLTLNERGLAKYLVQRIELR